MECVRIMCPICYFSCASEAGLALRILDRSLKFCLSPFICCFLPFLFHLRVLPSSFLDFVFLASPARVGSNPILVARCNIRSYVQSNNSTPARGFHMSWPLPRLDVYFRLCCFLHLAPHLHRRWSD